MLLNRLYSSLALLGLLGLGACQPTSEKQQAAAAPKAGSVLRYAKRFAIEHKEAYTLVHVFGNKLRPADTTASYVIGTDTVLKKNVPARYVFLKRPCRRIAALSSIYANMIYDLGDLDKLVAIDNMDYVINPQIAAKHQRGELKELLKGPEPDLEQTIALKPDIVFTFGMGEPGRDVNPKLAQSGIPVAISIDHLEESPLARAEWIRFYAAFIDKEALADSLFSATEKNYLALRELAQQAKEHPGILTETKYGDTWYVPGGKSYMAQLLSDAGARYVWQDDDRAGSLPLSFEQVYAKARNADFWLNLSMVTSKKELLSYEPRYAEFKAFKEGHLYNNNKVANAKGYSTYWETGMTYPDRILSDLIYIFHPELRPADRTGLYYYKQID